MTVRHCPGCGAVHQCHEPLYAGHVGYRIEWDHAEEWRDRRGARRTRLIPCVGTVLEVHPAEYPEGGGFRTQPDRLVVECDDGVVRVVDDWLFLQNLGAIRVLDRQRAA